jgi:hypothetical protein
MVFDRAHQIPSMVFWDFLAQPMIGSSLRGGVGPHGRCGNRPGDTERGWPADGQ